MLSTIFKTEISDLEAQIAELQAEINRRQQRITSLGEVESIASGAIASLQTALQKVSELCPEAIESLKSSILNLFGGGDAPGGGNDGDNLPGGGGSSPDEPNPDLSSNEPDSELSDTPTENENIYAQLVQMSDAAAYMKRFDGEVLSTYLGFNNKSKAQAWGTWCVQYGIGAGFEVRRAKRLTVFKYEAKLWGTSLQAIERLTECDLTQYPLKANLVVAKPNETEQPLAQADVIAPEHTLIDPLNVPVGCFLERSEDWISVEYFVRAHLITRVKGALTPQIKTLGRLIETHRRVAAYANQSSIARYFPSTETATLFCYYRRNKRGY